MTCGCVAQGDRVNADGSRQPWCVVHAGLPEAGVSLAETPDLTGRQARCSCGRREASDLDLAFFEFRGHGYGNAPTDRYYCGHAGWD